MARPKSLEPTDGELEILRVLWDQGPCELGIVKTALALRRAIATTTVATRLGVMLEKGLVTRSEGERGYVWATKLSRSKTARGLVSRLIEKAFDGSALGLVSQLLADRNLSDDDRAEIRRLLDDGESRGKGKR